jgi:hypothetical protein
MNGGMPIMKEEDVCLSQSGAGLGWRGWRSVPGAFQDDFSETRQEWREEASSNRVNSLLENAYLVYLVQKQKNLGHIQHVCGV